MQRPVSCLLLALLLPAVPAALQETERVSVDSFGVEANAQSMNCAVSADGLVVAFESLATDLVPGDTNSRRDIFVHDRVTGATTRVSVSTSGAQGDDNSSDPALSEDGRYVVFISKAKTLVAADTNDVEDVFLHDRNTGTTTRVSLSLTGGQASGRSYECDVTPDGRYITFSSAADNLVAVDTNSAFDVFHRDLTTGTNTLVSVSSSGVQGDSYSSRSAISEDGQIVAFDSNATNLVSGDTNGDDDVFVRDLTTGQTTRVSVDSSGAEGSSYSRFPTISYDGRYVAFESRSGTLVPNDDNSYVDVFLHDRVTAETSIMSVDSSGTLGNWISNVPSISADGRYVAFRSWANNLVPGDMNNSLDIFVRDTWNDLTTRVSVDSTGLEGDGHSYEPSISADGGFVGFDSESTNLIAADTNAMQDVFVHDVKLPPVPDIQANALDGPLILTAGTPLTLTCAVDGGDYVGKPIPCFHDWFVEAATPFGSYWLQPDLSWVPSGKPVPLFTFKIVAFPPMSIATGVLPPGTFEISFTIDDNADGVLDGTWSDSVLVTVQ